MSWPVSPIPKSCYIPRESDKRKFGLDQSRYQGPIVESKLGSYAWPWVDFVVARTGISWGYKDGWFKEFWKLYKRLGIPHGAYHVLYPMESVVEQVKNCKAQFDGGVFDGSVIVNDVELVHGATRKQLSEATYEFTNRLQDWAKKPVLIYTRFGFIQDSMDYTSARYVDFFEKSLWWMAQYPKINLEEGLLPREDDRKLFTPEELAGIKWKTLIHQTGDRMYGPLIGSASLQQDTNRWLGTDAEFVQIFGVGATQPEPEPTPIDISAELAAIRASATSIEQKVASL